MKKKQLLERYIGYYPNLYIVMLAMFWWMTGELTETDRNTVLTEVGYTYNSTDKTVTDGTTTYTMYQLLDNCVTNIYPTSDVIDYDMMTGIIDVVYNKGYITADQVTTLKGKVTK